MSRREAEEQGRRGETLAAWWLRLHGWRIVGRRLRVAGGEVDLIARRRGIVAFVEVKWRRRAADLDHAIDAWRLRRVAAAAAILAPRYTRGQDAIRIDVMLLAPRTRPRHLVNVWQP